jgi:hypothetical protein
MVNGLARLFGGVAIFLLFCPQSESQVPRVPVLVELFTSEGCSSCPPADALLERLDHNQPVSGAQVIVLSEHVDYWNRLGWTDPYSSAFYSRRQENYGRRFQLDSSYTPQMVVDGTSQFIGNDSSQAIAIITAACADQKVPVHLTSVRREAGKWTLRVEIDPVPAAAKGAEIVAALADESAKSQVARGENSGRELHHIAVVRSMTTLGKATGATFNKEFTLKTSADAEDVPQRVVAFIQGKDQGKVLGAVLLASR